MPPLLGPQLSTSWILSYTGEELLQYRCLARVIGKATWVHVLLRSHAGRVALLTPSPVTANSIPSGAGILGCTWMHRGGAIRASSVLSRFRARSPCRSCDELSDCQRHRLQSISRRSRGFHNKSGDFEQRQRPCSRAEKAK